MKTGLIDVGGGMRGIYAAGVLDGCIDRGITFDLGIGVSAGSANLASFMAGQRGRNYTFYTEYAMRRRYMGLCNCIRRRSYIDLDYVYGALSNSNGENPLDFPKIRDNAMEFIVVATDAETGRPHYFTKADMAQDDYAVFKASSAIPVVCRPYDAQGFPCYDGAISDPVPVRKALEWGCDRVILVLTKPEHVRRTSQKDDRLVPLLRRRHPAAAEGLHLRAERYNEGVGFAQALAKEGRALIVAPDDTCGVDTLTKKKDAMRALYEKGVRDAEKIERYLGN